MDRAQKHFLDRKKVTEMPKLTISTFVHTAKQLWSGRVEIFGCLTLTRVTIVEEGGGAATTGQEGQRWCHETLHDAALPRAETQAAG